MAKTSHYFSNSTIIIFVLSTIHPGLCLPANFFLRSQTDAGFIKTWCDATKDPVLCFATFTGYAAEIHGSPKILATKSLSVTLNTTLSAYKTLTELSKKQGLKPIAIVALKDCEEGISDSVSKLKKSIDEMDESTGKSFAFRMSNIQTWVSATLTNEDSCTQGFSEATIGGDVNATARTVIGKVAQLTSISLSFVNRYAAAKQ